MTKNTFKPAVAKVGGPWDGSNPETWPGVEGKAGVTNHYAHNINPFLPDPESTPLTHYNPETPKAGMSGGRKRKGKGKATKRKGKATKRKGKTTKRKGKTTKRKGKPTKSKGKPTKGKGKTSKRGGGSHGNTIVPQPVVNLGRNVVYQGENFWNALVGNAPAVDPDPMVQPIVKL